MEMLYNPFSLSGKIILVTGAASGIGRATAIECSKMGASVIITDIRENGLTETLHLLCGENREHRMITCDLTEDADLERMVSLLPMLDGMVNNAGITKPLPVKFINRGDIEKILSVNALAPIYLTQKLLKKKKLKKGASLVFTVSIGGVYTVAPGNAMYGVSKGALHVFMKNAALELASTGIRCNSVNPGMVDTNLVAGKQYSKDDRERDMKTYPMKRYGEPREVALGIVYLLSDASSFVTGHTLIIDGGKTLY